jgi:NDP-hexose-3-ketoreductase
LADAPLRIAVLGCADIAWRRMLPAVVATPGMRLVAVAGRDRARAERFTAEFGGEPVEGYEQVLARPDVEAVYVPLPPGLHTEWVAAALRAGKHVLAEKPLATTATDAASLVALADRRGLVLLENYMFVRHPLHAEVRRLLGDGVLGELRGFTGVFGVPPRPDGDIRYRPAPAGGALTDLGGYPLRAAQLFLGPELDVVAATARYDLRRAVDLSGTALLVTSAGVTAQLAFGLESSYRCAYELWGSRGRLVVERAFTPPPDHAPRILVERRGSTTEKVVAPCDQFAEVLRTFSLAVRERQAGDLGGGAILRQAALVERIRETAVWTGM